MTTESQIEKKGRLKFSKKLMLGTAIGTIAAMSSSLAVYAQGAAPSVETVVVTGSNIRGAVSTGQSLITVDAADIQATGAVSVQQLIATLVPQINGFGSAGQANQGSFEPRIHSVGGGASNSTLTLVDGHQIPASGGMYKVADPSVLPPDAVQRIDILPDGASAVYGANAVAGVINVVTRKDYNGWEASARYGAAADYSTADMSVIFGHSWDEGNLLATYAHSYRSELMAADRDFTGANRSSTGVGAHGDGGTNLNTYNCYPATIVPASGQTYAYPYTPGTAINSGSGTTNGICDTSVNTSLLPSEVANKAFVSINQRITSKLKISETFSYSQRFNNTIQSRGSESAVTVYGKGSSPPGGAGQINPFFVSIPGVTKETISFTLDGIPGLPRSTDKTGSLDLFSSTSLDYDIGWDWAASLTATFGQGTGTEVDSNSICIPCVNLALNGSVFAGGTQTANAAGDSVGTVTTVTRALTTANALNVWGAAGVTAAGGADTSQTILDYIHDATATRFCKRTMADIYLKFDGPLFPLPAGDVKAAIGGEYSQLGNIATNTANDGSGATSTNSSVAQQDLPRLVVALFAELQIPVVNAAMGIPLVKSLGLNFSGRIDKYSDVAANDGVTTNPKVGLDWQVYDDLKLRAAWGTSFTAPNVGYTTTFNAQYGDLRSSGNRAAFTIPSTYPGAATLCPTGCSFLQGAVGPLTGIVISGSNSSIVPQTGSDYSTGFTYAPSFLPGFYADVSFWGASYQHVITTSTGGPAANIANPNLYYLFTVNPSPAAIAAAIAGRTPTSPIPPSIQFILDERLTNLLNYQAQGLDYNISYRFGTADYGDFKVGMNFAQHTKFAQQAFTGAPWTQANNIGNASNTFSPVAIAGRFNFGWNYQDFSAQLFMNYTAPFYRTTTQVPFNTQRCPDNVTVTGLGCQKIGANITVDFHGSYNLPSDWVSGMQLSLDIQNVLDTEPPFENNTGGFDSTWANPIGRIVTVGVRKKF